eukprot:CAMPEP_0172514354 /NCGR_PEP_ID=MMETSP1066-20121228/259518_1 /TAXON_ID=671091 /ORGANISM="Coscinodiscus wailesii, Strain CCMP2513" /LENGTH=343 /DNA_ID=CAMNT_0013294989 /DNA_START=29 /DNA_END=1063 /DNA_ORIENTATION=-
MNIAAEFSSRRGIVLTEGEVFSRRLKRGLCATCGNPLFRVVKNKINPFKTHKIPLTIPGKSVEGRCLVCLARKNVPNCLMKTGYERKGLDRHGAFQRVTVLKHGEDVVPKESTVGPQPQGSSTDCSTDSSQLPPFEDDLKHFLKEEMERAHLDPAVEEEAPAPIPPHSPSSPSVDTVAVHSLMEKMFSHPRSDTDTKLALCEELLSLAAVSHDTKIEIIVRGGFAAAYQFAADPHDVSHARLQETVCETLNELVPMVDDAFLGQYSLVADVTGLMVLHAASVTIQECGVKIMRHLSERNEGYRKRIIDLGGQDIVLSAMRRHGTEGIKINGRQILRNLEACYD